MPLLTSPSSISSISSTSASASSFLSTFSIDQSPAGQRLSRRLRVSPAHHRQPDQSAHVVPLHGAHQAQHQVSNLSHTSPSPVDHTYIYLFIHHLIIILRTNSLIPLLFPSNILLLYLPCLSPHFPLVVDVLPTSSSLSSLFPNAEPLSSSGRWSAGSVSF